MRTNIVKLEKGIEGIALPEDYLRFLELIPGAEVELVLDEKRKWIIIRPLHGEDFVDHFKSSIDSMS